MILVKNAKNELYTALLCNWEIPEKRGVSSAAPLAPGTTARVVAVGRFGAGPVDKRQETIAQCSNSNH